MHITLQGTHSRLSCLLPSFQLVVSDARPKTFLHVLATLIVSFSGGAYVLIQWLVEICKHTGN